ncbi:FliM/FliN family flagellar motor switch protein [Salmonella enterica]
MSLRSHLRVRNASQTVLEILRQQHPGSEIAERQHGVRYLQLRLSNQFGIDAVAFLEIDLWLREMDLHLPGIPWLQVPLSYLTRWLNNLQLSFLVEDVVWEVQQIMLPSEPMPETLLSLAAQPCSLLCLEWPVSEDADSQRAISTSRLPFTLHYVLGQSQLPLSALTEIAIGDLLLIKDYSPTLNIGQRRVFSFSYDGNQEIIVEEFYGQYADEYQSEEEIALDWTKLPVNIEFVLDSSTVTLAELNNIGPGSALPVQLGAEQKIKIYLNRKLFALGELVALEEGGLAVEVNQMNPGAASEMSYSDAE